nr:HIT domain-containing protein [Anaerolineae bacterium]
MDHLWAPWRMTYLKSTDDMPNACIFCHKIAANDDAEHILYRSSTCYVTLNLYPYNNGHMLVVPFGHIASLDAMDEQPLLDLMLTTQKAIRVLREAYQPQAFNIGINQGAAAGAGIAGHLHQHIVPRWSGDTNYMSVIGQTRVIPEWVDTTFTELRAIWNILYPCK